MQSSNPLKHFIAAFIIALVVYVIAYTAIEHRRTRDGPWEVAFTVRDGAPALIINEPQLGISNVVIVFPGQPAPLTNVTLHFEQPRPVPFELPFGQCVFMDTTFQPGTLVFNEFGHEIQLIPRTLTLDKTERPWQSGAIIAMTNIARSPVNKANTSHGVP
jgi:hypothetical protein